MSDLFDDFEVISTYTNEQACEDGLKVKLAHGLYATRNCLQTICPEAFTSDGLDHRAVITAFIDAMRAYDAGMYFDHTAKYKDECDAYFAVYSVRGHTVWFILDGAGMHLILPEDH